MIELKTNKQIKKVLKDAFEVHLKELPIGSLISVWYESDTDVTRFYTNIENHIIINMVEENTFFKFENKKGDD